MLKYTVKRLLQSLVTIFLIATAVFLMMRCLPTDYYFTEEQLMKFTDQQKTAALEAAGLTDPIPTQLIKFYNDLLHLDFGTSRRIQNGASVVKVIGKKFGVSMRLVHEAEDLSAVLHISDVGEMNDVISRGQATQMILSHEAMMEKQIGDIAHEIAARKGVRFVMIAGPSSSGKTTFSHRLSTQLIACGLRPHAIATDNYFRNRADTPRDERGEYDFECLGAMDVEGFNRDMNRLLNGETVEMPTYNFIKGVREYNGETLTLGENDVLVIEGIHCLNDEFSKALPKESKYRIYISCLTTLNVDDHNRIPTTDARLLRRIERDARTRGYGARATIKMWPSVRRGEEENIFPYQDSADTVFNSALIYETALLKPYVEPLLFGVPHDCPEYLEAKRLLKFLNYFLPLPADNVPKTSLLREFVGGGCYKT